LNESCTSNPKSETSNWTIRKNPVQIRGFGFEVQDSFNFEILFLGPAAREI